MAEYLVYGTGKSGICAAALLKRAGKMPVLFDENTEHDTDGFYEKNPEISDVKIIKGKIDKETFGSVNTVVMSPGVPLDKPVVSELKNAGKKITGELELGYTFEKGRVCAITGTNGKTTTTSLVGHIAKLYYRDVFVAGNIGDPYTACADTTSDDSVTILEVSSFQLETANTFSPRVSAILNITPDHLDRHKTMEGYIEAKLSITKNQKSEDYVVLNYEDDVLRNFGRELNKNVIWFSSESRPDNGLYLDDGQILMSLSGETQKIINTRELQILGKHNYENAMAAIALCHVLGIPMDIIREGLKTFKAVEHRIEFVCEKSGVRYYNDSKGTNPDAAIKAVDAMEWPIILIAGGYDKKADYTEWINSFRGRVKHMLLIGQSAQDIADCANKNGFKELSFKNSLEDAVSEAKKIARDGDCVLLSPACASWGQFKNFEERGRLFKEYAKRD